MDNAISSERATIVRLVEAEWQSFWTPKGRWTRFPSSPERCYVAPSLIQTSDGLFEVGARALEVARIEYFALWFRAASSLDDRDSKPILVPRRMPARSPPKDLGIESFKGAEGRRCLLVVDHSAEAVGARLYGLVVNIERRSLMFFVDEDVPESALVTSDAGVIERTCAGRELIEL